MSNYSDQTSNSNHLSFHCHSGELLWGQLQCICEGYFNRLHDRYDAPQSVPEPSEGGTILRRGYQYRCRAAKGDWQAKLYRTRWTLKSEPFDSGYIIYNSHHNPVEILRRCANVGKYLDQSYSNCSIIYINRYGWSYHHRYNFESEINKLLGIDNKSKSDDGYSLKSLFHGRIMTIDSDSAMDFIQQFKSTSTEHGQSQEKVFIDTRHESNNRVGLHLSIPDTEYEFAWLVFSSDQLNSELIAVVYDGSYTLLDGQIILDQEDTVSWNEYESKTQGQACHEADLWEKLQADANIRTIMNNRGDKTVEQLADEFIAKSFRFDNSVEIVAKYSKEYNDFQLIADTMQKKLADCTDNNT